MRARFLVAALLCSFGVVAVMPRPSRAEEIPQEYKASIAKGLEWLAKQQSKDGHFESFGGGYPVTMTAISGMAFLMEGSTMREGKYKENIRRAAQHHEHRIARRAFFNHPFTTTENVEARLLTRRSSCVSERH